MNTPIKTPILKQGDRRTRQDMLDAHDAGRHGPPDAPLDILTYWAEICADCNARFRYEFAQKR